ncbi:MAG TPA: hypothetical protein PLZ16_09765, partial [Gammaproteobacteria bacterium]|nr:hypothetical protein [Gammaproteobacteria bacterium]
EMNKSANGGEKTEPQQRRQNRWRRFERHARDDPECHAGGSNGGTDNGGIGNRIGLIVIHEDRWLISMVS